MPIYGCYFAQICVVLLNMLSMCLSEQLLQKRNKIKPSIGPHSHINIDIIRYMPFINGLSSDSVVQIIYLKITPIFFHLTMKM